MATQGQTAPCAGYRDPLIGVGLTAASWRSGDAADCKSVYTGSIPVLASNKFPWIVSLFFRVSTQRL